MRSEFLPFCSESIGQEEIDEVLDTLKSGWITTGPKTRSFEQQFAEYLGAPGGARTFLLHGWLASLPDRIGRWPG